MADDGPPAGEIEGRVLLLPATRRDARAATAVFRAAGLPLALCDDLDAVRAEIARGAGVAVLPSEALIRDRDARLARLLAEQPPWSDFPLVVLVRPDQTAAAARALELVGHMTVLHRPVEVRSLVSAVRAALRDRERQYARRDDLAERERQAEALRENDRHKDEFLAMLAHELRNPLAAVNNAVAVMKRAGDEASRSWAVDVVARQVRQLVRLIDDLLDVARITGGKIRLRPERTDAGPILDQAIESARPMIDARRQALSVLVERGRLPLEVDAPRIAQVVLNLLSNASRYGHDGGRIWLTARRRADEAVIAVRDDGVGVPPDQLPGLFRLFAQGDRSLARTEGGLGIGLTLVERLVEMHGGSVEARSDGPGTGSEFVVRLPIAPEAEADGRADGDGRLARRAPRRARILVVDDNSDSALGMVRLLELLGHEASASHDGPAALAAARASRPDVVLLDLGLPGMDGHQVAAAFRRDDDLRGAVLVALTGYGQEADRLRSRASGFDHHLVKPIDPDDLAPILDGRG